MNNIGKESQNLSLFLLATSLGVTMIALAFSFFLFAFFENLNLKDYSKLIYTGLALMTASLIILVVSLLCIKKKIKNYRDLEVEKLNEIDLPWLVPLTRELRLEQVKMKRALNDKSRI